jgi:SAM-dependent methyltransferase
MEQSNRWNRIRHCLYAPIYDIVARPLRRGRKRAIERLDLAAGDRVLLLGAGTGAALAYLPADVSVTAVDLTPAMVERIEARADSLGMDVDARVGDAQSLDLPADAFDAVTLHPVLSVVPDPAAVLAETERVLASGGQSPGAGPVLRHDPLARPVGRGDRPRTRGVGVVPRRFLHGDDGDAFPTAVSGSGADEPRRPLSAAPCQHLPNRRKAAF